MKTIGKLKLTQLSKADLEARQMNAIRGGGSDDNTCVCGCHYNSIANNGNANSKSGYQYSAGGGTATVTCEYRVGQVMAEVRGDPSYGNEWP